MEAKQTRNIWLPNMKVTKLNRVLSKTILSDKDIDLLKDFLEFLTNSFYKQDVIEKGFVYAVLDSSANGFILKNKFWITNIKSRIEEYEFKRKK